MKDLELALHAAAELQRRKIDGLEMFRPSKRQEPVLLCQARECLVKGGHRSGKTTVAAVRFAAIARDKPITFADGSVHDVRLPWQKGRPLIMWVIGYGGSHIGQTIWRVLFRAGLYKIIRDLKTREWRVFDPVGDKGREEECKPSPPLIPMSEVEHEGSPPGIAWENKGENHFNVVNLKNGTKIYAYSSMGEVKSGDPVDEIWIDESIAYPKYYPDWQARGMDTKGRLFWSAWPNRGNSALRNLSKRAGQALKDGQTDWVQEFTFTSSGNEFIDSEERRRVSSQYSQEERMARDLGEFALDSLKMYPHFAPEIHCAYGPNADGDDELAAVLRATKGQPPPDWMRAMILDPGTNYPGVLFVAIPPTAFGYYLVPYDELYPGRTNAEQLAKKILDKSFGQFFEWFIIDIHAASPQPMGFGISVGENYSRAFRELKLSCRQTGSSFTPGSTDVIARIGLVNRLMNIQGNGRPQLRIVTENCKNLCDQLLNYEKGVHELTGEILETPAKHQHVDVAVALEYAASRQLSYLAPPQNTVSRASMSPGIRRWLEERDRTERTAMVHCGPDAAYQSAL